MLLATTLIVCGCQSATELERLGYFKSETNMRLFKLGAPTETPADRIMEAASNLPHTEGRTTLAFIYSADLAPEEAHDVTQAANWLTATEMPYATHLANWRWRMAIAPDGTTTWTDCTEAPDESICP